MSYYSIHGPLVENGARLTFIGKMSLKRDFFSLSIIHIFHLLVEVLFLDIIMAGLYILNIQTTFVMSLLANLLSLSYILCCNDLMHIIG